MEQDKGVDFQSLRARFQNDETLKIRIKPAIPEKPKTLTSPTTKINNPLIASINSAMEHRMPVTPRVVFKDDKKSPVKRQLSQSEALPLKVPDPCVHPELVDKKQKKEGDLIKQALKDKNLPLVLPVNPVTPVIEGTPKPDPIPSSPVLTPPSKASTPKKKSLFNFSKSAKAEKESPVLDSLAPSSSTPTSSAPILNKPVAPKALVPPVQAEVVPASSNQIPIIPAPVIFPAENSEIPVPTVPEPDIVSQISPELEILKPEIPVIHNTSVTVPEPDVSLPEEEIHPSEIPDIFDMDIPPPIIPEDIPDADISALDIPAPVTPDLPIAAFSASSTPVYSSPNLSRTASSASTVSASVTPEPSVNLLPPTVTPNSEAASSPRTSPILPSTAPDVKLVTENGTAKVEDQTEKTPDSSSTSPKPISALSVLARAEEMAPIRHAPHDQRVLNLLEKAKRKQTVSHHMPTLSTPETEEMTLLDRTSPAFTPLESSAPENSQPEAARPEPVPTVEAAPVPQTLVVDLPDIPPVDYEEQSRHCTTVVSDTPSSESALTNGLDHSRASPVPKVPAEQKPATVKAKPPPPPPRKTPLTIRNGSVTPEKPACVTSTDVQTSTLPAQPVEENGIIIPAPVDFTSENSTLDDSDDSSEFMNKLF
ncbi:uncharacterized protein [Salminus brasiliensis]|uniref:uncharacterized protein n=1 Tax=Salminus brasiliensis TaxID=930266 RepID=UPI003B837CD5